MKTKFLLLLPIVLLAASCNIFSKGSVGGVAKTVNGGADWLLSNQLSQSKETLVSQSISRLALDPANREHIYAGSFTGGLYLSEDSGGTWRNILSRISVYDFAVDPNNASVLYSAGSFGGVGKVLKSTDGGKSWLQRYSEAVAETPVRSLALNPKDTSQILIGTESGNIILSRDGGQGWQLLRDFKDRINKVYWTNNGVYVLARNKGLFKGSGTVDDFQEISQGLKNSNLLNQFSAQGSVQTFNQAYVDEISPNLMYVTTDKGLYKSTNGGSSWDAIKLPVKQDQLAARPVVVSKQNSNTVLTAVGATVYKSTDGGQTFQTQALPSVNGIVYSLLVDPVLPQIMYAGIYINN